MSNVDILCTLGGMNKIFVYRYYFDLLRYMYQVPVIK